MFGVDFEALLISVELKFVVGLSEVVMGGSAWRLILVLLIIGSGSHVHARSRILWLDSYDPSNKWTAEMGKAIRSTLQGQDVEFKVHHMDTKRNKSEAYKKKAALKAVDLIKGYQPHVVIASEDNASKYVVEPFFKNTSIPFVFCGVNHTAKRYGYPYQNATGIIELDPIPKLIFSLSRFHFVDKVGYLAEDGTSARINGNVYKTQTRFHCVEYYVNSMAEWIKTYRRAQSEVDVLIIGNISAIKDWNTQSAMDTILSDSKIPSGCLLEFLTPMAFIGCIKLPSEQGRWAARTALKIINGTPVDSIPVAEPVDGKLIVNLKIAQALGITVPKSYIDKADALIQ
jgi:ABC-type uncharacterized transport system substrate-binding protein